MLGRALLPVAAKLPEADPEMIYLVLSSTYFGPLLYGLLLGGVFAAILSTADSQLLVVASTFVRDVYEKILSKNSILEEKKRLRLSRMVVVSSGASVPIFVMGHSSVIFILIPAGNFS